MNFPLPNGWVWARCHDVIDVRDGTHDTPQKVESGIPMVTSKNLKPYGIDFDDVTYISEDDYESIEKRSGVDDGDILFAMIGTIGNPVLVKKDRPFSIKNVALFKIDETKVHAPFFKFMLDSPVITQQLDANSRGGNQKFVSLSSLRNMQLPLPPLPEQKRIAAILDKADSVRRKRQEAVRLTEELLRSVFLEMFGDPVTNPKGWNVVEFSELCEELRYGTSNMCSTDRQGQDLPVLRIPNVIDGLINWDNMKYVQLPDAEVKRLRLEQGDMLFVRTNGNPEYIGRCAVFDDTRTALYASYLIRARLKNDSSCLPQYASSCFMFPTYRKRLVAEAKTTAGNFNINTEGLKSLKLSVPPLSSQQKFLTLRNRLATSIVKLQSGVDVSNTLFNSLLHRAFKGGL